MGLNGYELFLPSTLVRVSTGLLQADSGATLAECFFMMTSSDGLSSKPLRLHPWSWFGADTRPLDGTLDVSRAGLLLFVPSHPSNSLLMFFFFCLCRFPPPPSSTCLPSSSLLYPARPGWSLLTYSLAIAAIRQRHTSIRPPAPPVPKQACPLSSLPNPRGRGISSWACLDGGTCQHAVKLWMESMTDMMGPIYLMWCGVVQPIDTLTAIVSG